MNWKISWKSTLRPCEFCCIAARPAYFPNFIYLYLTGCRLLKWTYKIEKLTWSQFWNKVWAFHGLLSASPKMGWWSESRDVELNEFKFSLASRKMLFNLRRNKAWSKRGKKEEIGHFRQKWGIFLFQNTEAKANNSIDLPWNSCWVSWIGLITRHEVKYAKTRESGGPFDPSLKRNCKNISASFWETCRNFVQSLW